MANYWPSVWAELRAAIDAVWPEVSVIFRGTQAAKVNWNNAVESFRTTGQGGFALPYVVVQVGAASADPNWGMGNSALTLPIAVYYIADTKVSKDIAAFVEGKLYDFKTTFETTRFENFQVIDGLSLDVSESNGANTVFLGSEIALFGGSAMFSVLVGETTLYEDVPTESAASAFGFFGATMPGISGFMG